MTGEPLPVDAEALAQEQLQCAYDALVGTGRIGAAPLLYGHVWLREGEPTGAYLIICDAEGILRAIRPLRGSARATLGPVADLDAWFAAQHWLRTGVVVAIQGQDPSLN